MILSKKKSVGIKDYVCALKDRCIIKVKSLPRTVRPRKRPREIYSTLSYFNEMNQQSLRKILYTIGY